MRRFSQLFRCSAATLIAAIISAPSLAQGYFSLNYDTLFYEQPNVQTAGQGVESETLIIIKDPRFPDFDRSEPVIDLDLTLQSVRLKYGYSIFNWLKTNKLPYA